jgi:hypothetical protein
MTKLFLLSVLVAMIAVPTFAARGAGARRGLGRALWLLAVIVFGYWLGVLGLPPPAGADGG